jgi:casein kinase II subunit beta
MSKQGEPTWQEWFLSLRGNEYFCEVEDEFILDRFNLTGIGHDIPQFKKAYELITGAYEEIDDSETRMIIEKSARHTFGLIHARYILTSAGLENMLRKYQASDFGHCPRVLCRGCKLLPLGVSDLPGVEGVKLFCPHCEDVYGPKSARHSGIDGAYFGTTFAHLFIQTYPELTPLKSTERYVPKIFGFRIADRCPPASPDSWRAGEQ